MAESKWMKNVFSYYDKKEKGECPFCGSKNVELIVHFTGSLSFRCLNCGKGDHFDCVGRGDIVSEKPYFLSNSEWYYFDEVDYCYKLTDKAPKDAVQSYNEFYKSLESKKRFDD